MNIFSVEELKMEVPWTTLVVRIMILRSGKKVCNFCRQNELHHKTKKNFPINGLYVSLNVINAINLQTSFFFVIKVR